MLILPAIDVKGGRCVRLRQGRPEDETVYSDDPVAMARRWVAEGAPYLHIVDLDGAFQGRPVHTAVVEAIARAVPVPVQVGGGIRTEADIQSLLACGVGRVVVGTRAFEQPEALPRWAERYGKRIAVGIDARDGWVQIRGWQETTRVRAVDLAQRAHAAGIRTLIVTDTAVDGMLSGVRVDTVEAVCAAVTAEVIASGGLRSVEDVRALKALRRINLVGVIVGRALYEGTVSLTTLLTAAHEPVTASGFRRSRPD